MMPCTDSGSLRSTPSGREINGKKMEEEGRKIGGS